MTASAPADSDDSSPPAARLVLRPTGYNSAEVRLLVDEVQQEYVRRYGGPDDAVVDAAQFAAPRGLFVVGFHQDRPVAMGGWRRLPDDVFGPDVAEVKRMFVVAAARRLGFARTVLHELERTAAGAGVRLLVLNTGTEQPEAIRLYESSGYLTVAGFGHYAHSPKALFYGKEVQAAVSRG